MIRGQTDQINCPKILLQKKKKKNTNQSKDAEYIKKVSLHPRDCLKHKKKIKQEPEVHNIKTLPEHPGDRLSRRLKKNFHRREAIICKIDAIR